MNTRDERSCYCRFSGTNLRCLILTKPFSTRYWFSELLKLVAAYIGYMDEKPMKSTLRSSLMNATLTHNIQMRTHLTLLHHTRTADKYTLSCFDITTQNETIDDDERKMWREKERERKTTAPTWQQMMREEAPIFFAAFIIIFFECKFVCRNVRCTYVVHYRLRPHSSFTTFAFAIHFAASLCFHKFQCHSS